ncbi:MAG: Pycsar system effector family protein [Salegentibacter sp.]
MIIESEQSLKSKRGKETMFRVAYRNQTSLRQIADNKANMVISINTLIISSIIAIMGYGIVSNNMDLYLEKLIPVAIIVITCLLSAVLAIVAANPRYVKPELKNLEDKQSLLFFGEMAGYSQEEYLQKMEELLNSREDIYKNMIIDLHCQGIILTYKFRYISYAYNALMFGFSVGVIIFIVFLFLQ